MESIRVIAGGIDIKSRFPDQEITVLADQNQVHQVFDPYFTTRGLGNASGMGLTMVHAMIKNHKGAITVDGRPGKGAAFTLLFPLPAAASN